MWLAPASPPAVVWGYLHSEWHIKEQERPRQTAARWLGGCMRAQLEKVPSDVYWLEVGMQRMSAIWAHPLVGGVSDCHWGFYHGPIDAGSPYQKGRSIEVWTNNGAARCRGPRWGSNARLQAMCIWAKWIIPWLEKNSILCKIIQWSHCQVDYLKYQTFFKKWQDKMAVMCTLIYCILELFQG